MKDKFEYFRPTEAAPKDVGSIHSSLRWASGKISRYKTLEDRKNEALDAIGSVGILFIKQDPAMYSPVRNFRDSDKFK